MSILPTDVQEGRLRELCGQRCPESQTLDFKRMLPGLVDKDKSDFLKDICAFANSDGGDLVYGIAEEGGKAQELIPITGEAADAARRRLGQVIDAGLEPRVVGLRIQDVPVAGGYVLIVRVPASFNGPHRYVVNGVGRFVMRNGTHTTELTFDQLRSAFDRTATLADRARQFRLERLTAVAAGRTWRPLTAGPICVAHLIPIAAMAGNGLVDVQELYNNFTRFMFDGWGGASRSTNLDGLVVYPPGGGNNGQTAAFTQVYRSGSFEAVRLGGGELEPGRIVIHASTVSYFFRSAIQKFLDASRALGIAGPAIVGIALLSVERLEFSLGDRFFRFNGAFADRDNLVVPESWMADIDSIANVDEIARPLLDVLWQAFDIQRCELYDAGGNWRGR